MGTANAVRRDPYKIDDNFIIDVYKEIIQLFTLDLEISLYFYKLLEILL